jgi:DNA-binding NarL/FixJ family response regulator
MGGSSREQWSSQSTNWRRCYKLVILGSFSRFHLMNRTQRFQPDEEAIEKLRQEVRAAAEAYFLAAAAHKGVILETKAKGWKADPDGHQSLYSAARFERSELEKYARLVGALKAAVLKTSKPAKPHSRGSRKLTGRPLSPRENEILKLIAEGLSSREISDKLKISFKTAVAHRYHIMAKLGVHDVVTLVLHALRNRLITP